MFTTGIVATADGKLILSNKGDKSVRVYSPDNLSKPEQTWTFPQTPTGVAVSPDGNKLYVTAFDTRGELYVIDRASGSAQPGIRVGHGPNAPVVSPDGSKVYVLNQFSDDISEVDAQSGKVNRTVKVLREPVGGVISKDGRYLFVMNHLPVTRADLDYVAADVSVIDLNTFQKVKDLKLANGSNALRGISIAPDGKYVFVSHNLGRFTVPTSQLQQGWMNTSAMSVIDVDKQDFIGSVILDEPERGAAGVWGIACLNDKIFVTHSGTHDMSVIDYPKMIEKLRGYKAGTEALSYDLRFLYGIRQRVALEGNGPRGMAIVGDKVYIPTYFADVMNVLEAGNNQVSPVTMVANRQESDAQEGERIFNDASYCFQNWQSCNGCHPGDARTDGMNWDLMNDGIGNPKNCKSLLYSHVTPPSMISGIRESAQLAVRKGFTHIQFYDIDEKLAEKVDTYLMGLEAVPSPYLVDGQLSENAKKGRKVFEKLKCDECHSGPYYTDMRFHRIGEDIEFDQGWDTPTLREVWRTAPYLFDGRAATMKEVYTVHKHGITGKISDKEIDQLVEYVNSL